jgi:hypothetical protein
VLQARLEDCLWFNCLAIKPPELFILWLLCKGCICAVQLSHTRLELSCEMEFVFACGVQDFGTHIRTFSLLLMSLVCNHSRHGHDLPNTHLMVWRWSRPYSRPCHSCQVLLVLLSIHRLCLWPCFVQDFMKLSISMKYMSF